MARKLPSEDHLAVRRELLDSHGVARALARIAHEVVERQHGAEGLLLVGIRTGGVYLAQRLAKLVGEIEKRAVEIGSVDITLYRDDVFRGLPRPEIGPTELPRSIDERTIVLVDDVLYTGRTVRAALDVLMEFGRPKKVELAVLVDRGHRELPIRADYTGLEVQTTPAESVRVILTEEGEAAADSVVLRERVA